MLSFPVALSLLLLVDGPDLYEEPLRFDVGVPPCLSDAECHPDAPLCSLETGECVACLGPEHCQEGWGCTPEGACHDACEVDGDCEGIDEQSLCNPETGFCVQCVGTGDCLEEQYCNENGFCLNDFCTPGETLCVGQAIHLCLEDGGTTMEVEVCPELCEANDTVAQCESAGSSGGSGGAGSGGSATGAGTGAEAGTGGGAGTADVGGSGGTALDDEPGASGCACRATSSSEGRGAAWSGLLGLLFAGLARRRRRAGIVIG